MRIELALFVALTIIICMVGYLNITFAKRQGYIAGYEAGKIDTLRETINSELCRSTIVQLPERTETPMLDITDFIEPSPSKIDGLLDKGVEQEANDAK